jgi:hypothetical protein
MSTTIRNNRGAMPTWAKVLLGLVIVGFLGIVTIGIAIYVYVTQNFVMDPVKVAAMAKNVATFEEPLPGGWKWGMGMDLQVMKMVIAQAPDQQSLILLSVPSADKSAKDLMHDTTITTNSRTRMTAIEKTGTETVAGLPMEYELGTIEKDGQQSKGFMGAIVDRDKKKSLFVVGVQPEGEYNLPETQQFLKSIKQL